VMSKEKKFDSINEYEEFDFGPRSLATYKKTGHVIVGSSLSCRAAERVFCSYGSHGLV